MDNEQNELELLIQGYKFDVSNIARLTRLGLLRFIKDVYKKTIYNSRSSDEAWHKLENNICTKATMQTELRRCKVQRAMESISC